MLCACAHVRTSHGGHLGSHLFTRHESRATKRISPRCSIEFRAAHAPNPDHDPFWRQLASDATPGRSVPRHGTPQATVCVFRDRGGIGHLSRRVPAYEKTRPRSAGAPTAIGAIVFLPRLPAARTLRVRPVCFLCNSPAVPVISRPSPRIRTTLPARFTAN